MLFISPLQSATGVTIKTWTVESGLPQNAVHSICQSPDGYLWVATFDGLVRFDGVRLSTFNRSNTPGINGNRFASLVCAPDGDVWIGTEGTGITRYHHGQFTTYNERHGLRSSQITGLSSSSNQLWVLASGAVHVWRPDKDRFELIGGDGYLYSIAAAVPSGVGFWKIGGDTLSVFLRGERRVFQLPSAWKRYSAVSVGVNAAGELYAATQDGHLLRFTKQGTPDSSCAGGAPHSKLRCGAQSDYLDKQGHRWQTSMNWTREAGWLQYMELPPGCPLPRIEFTALYEDTDGNLWLAGIGRGLVRLHPASIRVLSREEGLPDRNVYSVYEGRDGSVWIGGWTGGLTRIRNGQIRIYTIADGLGSNRINSVFEDNTGTIWVSTSAGLSRLRKDRFFRVPGIDLPDGVGIRAINQDRDGAILLGTSAGLIRFRNGQKTVLTKSHGLATDDVRVILPARDGVLWVAGYGGLSRLQGSRVQAWTEREGLPSNTIRALYEDGAGVLWIGTYDGGLGRLFEGKITTYGVQQGMFNDGVFQILEDSRDNLWMSSNRGIHRVSKKDLNNFADGRTSFVSSTAFGTSDGMRNAECNGGLGLSGVRTRDGTMWFPTQDGVALFNPEQLEEQHKPPPVLIEACSVNGVAKDIGTPIPIPPDTGEIQIAYTALGLRTPERIRFQYRLDSLDSTWVEAGHRRTAYYSHIAPGRYVFRVRAAYDENTWSPETAGLVLVVQPRYYETWWFRASLFIAVSLIVWTLWQYRVRQLERARQAQEDFARKLMASQEAERKRIAGELHDSLGQQLLIMKNWAALALSNVDMQKSPREPLTEISSTASIAIEDMRGIAYNLRPYQLEKLGLTAAIRGLVNRVTSSSGIRFTAEIENVDNLFSQDAEISIYRIIQEALSNVVRHSEAATGRVLITRDSGSLNIMVKDDGRGFTPPDSRLSSQNQKGFGLLGITERVRLLGGRIDVHSAVGHGSTIQISLRTPRS